MERNTLQKNVIYKTVISMDHPSADEVYKEVQRKYPGISRATVFRVLAGLSDKGKIRKIGMADTADRYDFMLDEHSHVVCRTCGRVADVARGGFESISRPSENLSGFLIESFTVTYSGLCPECVKNHIIKER